MAWYPKAVRKNIPPGPTDPRITPRLAILHVDAGNASSLYGYFNGRSGGVESHFFVRKDGVVEQYRDTAYQADANMEANDFAVSIETQGYGAGEWTPQQLASIKALLVWLHAVHGIPLVKATRWDGAGVGYHNLFPTQWAGGPRSCPGPDRIKQFTTQLVPWMATATTAGKDVDDMTRDELKEAIREVLAEEETARQLFTGHAIVKDTRPGGNPKHRVSPSALLEQAAKQ
jgi:hypothetical protein